jgi:hypothetical protein
MMITGKDLYLARYEHEGGMWEANEHQQIWNEWADRLNARLASDRPSEAKEESRGTSACPICGVDTPHRHSPDEVKLYRAKQMGLSGGMILADHGEAIYEVVDVQHLGKAASPALVEPYLFKTPDRSSHVMQAGTVIGGDVDGNQVTVSLDTKPSRELWTLGTRIEIRAASDHPSDAKEPE